MNASIISCVGLRPLAVITPINSLLRAKSGFKNVTITLLVTNSTHTLGSACEKWVNESFPAATVNIEKFDDVEKVITDLSDPDTTVYFNINPGMNWEVSLLALLLPSTARCLYSDTRYLYIWQMDKDTGTCEKIKLHDMSRDTFVRFSPEIEITSTKGIKRSFDQKIVDCLKDLELQNFNVNETITLKTNSIPNQIADEINDALVYVREQKGQLYMLFDLHGKNKDFYRLITNIYDPIHYSVTIMTDDASLIRRAQIEGTNFIQTTQNDWKQLTDDWFRGNFKIIPKMVAPKITWTDAFGDSWKNDGRILFVALGDNIEPTLKAVYSQQWSNVVLLYDRKSPRISFFAQRLVERLIQRNIRVFPFRTSYIAEGVIRFFMERYRKANDWHFNITPGTKMQTVALTVLARQADRANAIYSIKRDWVEKEEYITGIVENRNLSLAVAPSIDDLMVINMPPFQRTQKISSLNLWDNILNGLAAGSLKPDGAITGITTTGGVKLYKRVKKDCIKAGGQCWQIDESFLDFKNGKIGSWWEAVVAKALSAYFQRVDWQIQWDWPGGSKKPYFYSELDLALQYKTHVVVVSCKTEIGKREAKLQEAAFMVKSETSKRFGRFALPLVAVPYEEIGNLDLKSTTIYGVRFLTPKLLKQKDKLVQCFDEMIKAASTTST